MNKVCLSILIAVVFAAAAPASLDAGKARRIPISVTGDGFVPKRVEVAKDEPLTLVFTRKTDKTCATNVVIHVAADKKIERDLPLDQPVVVDVRFPKSGQLTFACGMGHVGGVIVVQ